MDKRDQEKLKHMADHDFLTDLPNRSFFNTTLESAMLRAKSSGKLLAVLFLDMDHFKEINDTYGHDVGDEVLKAFSSRIKKSIRETDTAARFGGDEFVVLLDEITHQDNAINVAQKIIENMQNHPFTFKDVKINISTSIGIAIFNDKNVQANELIKQADNALLAAKAAGRNNYKLA